jgi:hypothetical protein
MEYHSYKWIRVPDDVKQCVLKFIADRSYRISATPAPLLLVHPVDVTVEEILGRPIAQYLDGAFDSLLFVPFGDKMIAAWCRSLEVELKDA